MEHLQHNCQVRFSDAVRARKTANYQLQLFLRILSRVLPPKYYAIELKPRANITAVALCFSVREKCMLFAWTF